MHKALGFLWGRAAGRPGGAYRHRRRPRSPSSSATAYQRAMMAAATILLIQYSSSSYYIKSSVRSHPASDLFFLINLLSGETSKNREAKSGRKSPRFFTPGHMPLLCEAGIRVVPTQKKRALWLALLTKE